MVQISINGRAAIPVPLEGGVFSRGRSVRLSQINLDFPASTVSCASALAVAAESGDVLSAIAVMQEQIGAKEPFGVTCLRATTDERLGLYRAQIPGVRLLFPGEKHSSRYWDSRRFSFDSTTAKGAAQGYFERLVAPSRFLSGSSEPARLLVLGLRRDVDRAYIVTPGVV